MIDAEIPQTAKVDRKTAAVKVEYELLNFLQLNVLLYNVRKTQILLC